MLPIWSLRLGKLAVGTQKSHGFPGGLFVSFGGSKYTPVDGWMHGTFNGTFGSSRSI